MSQFYDFSDLTIGEVRTLVSYFFTALFVCLIVFVIPWIFLVGLGWAVESVAPAETFNWLGRVLGLGCLALVGWMLINDLPAFLKGIGGMFITLSETAVSTSRTKRALG